MGEMTIEQLTSQVLKSSVQDVGADGTMTVQTTFESFKTSMTSPMATMAYDSANPDAGTDPMSAMLKKVFTDFVGASFTMVISPTGEVQKVEGFTKLADKMFSNLPQEPAAANMMNGFKASLSDDAMRTMFSQTFVALPGRPVKPGDSWNGQFVSKNPMLGALVTSVKATLKSVEASAGDQVATIATALAIKQDPKSATAASNPLGLPTQVGDSSGEGEMFFNVTKGRLQKSTTRVLLPMTMSGPGPDGSQVNMKMNVKSTLTMELMP
jgi:hypothetical protein